MGDSYRPNRYGDDRYRRRDYHDQDNANYVGYDTRRRHRGSDRSRSPPRRLSYDEGTAEAHDSYSYGYATRGDPRPLPRPYYGDAEPEPANRGEKDASSDPTVQWKFLLIRNVKQTASEAVFAKGMEKLNREEDDGVGALPGSLKRVLLIRDRRTDDSMGFGFAEYHNLADAKMAVQKAKVLESRGQLTISSTDVTVQFPHLGVFPPDGASGRPEHYPKFKFTIQEGREHVYHDKRYYASPYDVNVESPYADSLNQATDEDTKKKRKSILKKKGQDDGTLDGPSRKRKAPSTAAPSILNTWAKKQAELNEYLEERSTPQPPATGSNAVLSTVQSEDTDEESETYAYEYEGSFNCYLCLSTFQNKDKVHVHLRDSKKHADGLKNDASVSKALVRLKAKGLDASTSIQLPRAPQVQESTISNAQYRDRAAERRKKEAETGITSEPPVPQKVGFSIKGKASKGQSASSSDNEAPSKPAFGLGSKMLAKHGWSEGTGLGKAGEGMTAALETNVYTSGVGLGHEESKKGDAVEEAQKATMESNKGYAQAGRDRQWKRYYDK